MLIIKFKRIIIKIILSIIPKQIISIVREDLLQFASLSYSQEGEDMILARIFENQSNGFYIDVGAHHPKRFSNTMYFYKQGWRGINIDATPGSMKLFFKERKLDINLEVAISDSNKTLTFHIFDEPALNTFSKDLAKEYINSNHKLIEKFEIRTRSLESVLDEYMLFSQKISFLSIDVEGLDFEVIKSNNWEKYRPQVILLEFQKFDIENFLKSDNYKFMQDSGYRFFGKTYNTVFLENVN